MEEGSWWNSSSSAMKISLFIDVRLKFEQADCFTTDVIKKSGFRGKDHGQIFICEELLHNTDLVPSLQSGRLVMMSVILSSAGRAETLPCSVFIDQ